MDIRKGNTAEVFDWDRGKVCKLFYQGIPYEYVQQEYENAKELFKLGICVPKVFELVDSTGRHGIIYEKIEGLPMWEYIDREDIWETFIAEHNKLLDYSTDVLMSYKDFLIAVISGGNNGESTGNITKWISELPNGSFILHGDYHPGNVMITAEGRFVIIDLLNVCCGPREYDVARTFFLLGNENWQDRYLKGMGYCKKDIEGYLRIIRETRKYE